MQRESGNRDSSIWLIGDSSPPRWEEELDEPLDSRHPARHNIWTPVLEGIQKEVFLGDHRRVGDCHLYTRNAVHNPEDRPAYGAVDWSSKVKEGTACLGKLLETYEPPLVFTFGAFAFEFARRSLARGPRKSRRHWTTRALGKEFNRSVKEFNPEKVNVFPLLHVSIARGQFLKGHEHFTGEDTGNYFDFVATQIATLLLDHKKTLNVWIRPQFATRNKNRGK